MGKNESKVANQRKQRESQVSASAIFGAIEETVKKKPEPPQEHQETPPAPEPAEKAPEPSAGPHVATCGLAECDVEVEYPRLYCSNAHRQKAYRLRRDAEYRAWRDSE